MATAEERALSALTKVNQIGFAEFTAKLIGDKLPQPQRKRPARRT